MLIKYTLFVFITILSSISSLYAICEEVNLGPLFSYKNYQEENKKEITALGPFFIYKLEDNYREFGFRPLFYHEYDYDKDKKNVDILYPLAGYRRQERDIDFNILFFLTYKSRHKDSYVQRDFNIFPFLFSRFSNSDEDDYLALFPLYGNLKNKFHKERIKFIFFPLFLQTQSDGETNNHILWPFIGYYTGEGVEGFKIWPFYGYKKKKNPYLDDKFVLWPFYVKREKQFYDEQVSYVSYLPFYSEMDSKNISQRSYLWPFFNKYEDRKNNFKRIDVPWPLFNITRGNKHENRMFPFFAKEVSGEDEDGFILWPLYSYKTIDLDNYKISRKYYLLFLYKDIKEIPKNVNGHSSRRIYLWPLLSYKRDRMGNRYINLLSILEPFLSDNKPIKNNFSSFWTLYENKKLVSGEETTSILWNTYKSRSFNGNRLIQINPLFPLFEYSKIENITTYKFFGGIIDYKRIKIVSSNDLDL